MTAAGTPDRPPRAAVAPAVTEEQREHVAQALSMHYANDRLSLDALDDRMERVYSSRSVDELLALLSDLPALSTAGLGPSRAELVAPDSMVPPRGIAIAFMAGFERRGRWVMPRVFKAIAVMGGGVIDLREARLAAGVTDLEIYCCMGGCEVFVPPGVRVEVLGAAFMGGFASSAGDANNESVDQPVLRVTGFAFMGGVDVQTKGPSQKALKKYQKAMERKARQ